MQIREMIYRSAGIFHPDNKLALLRDRCLRRMKVVNAPGLREYLHYLSQSPVRQSELVALLNEITIGETCFFRNRLQLDALCRIVLPAIVQTKLNGASRCLRIWSAGCSTGEEPYTLRMLLLEQTFVDLKNWSLTIFATDLNENSLAHARKGFYDSHSLRNLEPLYRNNYFVAHGDQLRVNPHARNNISFSCLNFSDDDQMARMKSMDIILCCNVLIYFDLISKQRVLRHFHNNLLPSGYLFLGNSESLYGVCDDFQLVHLPGATAYRKAQRSFAGGDGI